jgi:two-component system, sensor histidine kinase PdtaS
MSWYIQELVNYLKDSFDTENKIKFNLEIQPIELDVAQAIPLGLIMNEAITNAIKYAFPDRKGIIDIELKEIANLKNKLMMGLTEQLDGIFKINSERGVLITIEFTKKEAEI